MVACAGPLFVDGCLENNSGAAIYVCPFPTMAQASIYSLESCLLSQYCWFSWHGYQASKHTRTDIICHPSTFKLKNAQIITSIFIPRNNRPLAHYPFDLL